MPDPKTDELRVDQIQRELEERRNAKQAEMAEETQQHERRADKAAYLREKLTERAAAEDERAD